MFFLEQMNGKAVSDENRFTMKEEGSDYPDEKKIEFALKIFDANFSIIQFADTKASILLGISGVMLSIIVGFGDAKDNWVLIIGLVFLVLSSVSSLLVIRPRDSSKQYKTLTFYQGIVANYKSAGEYLIKLQGLQEQNILEDLSKNIFNLSEVLTKKYSFVKLSWFFLLLSFISLILSIF